MKLTKLELECLCVAVNSFIYESYDSNYYITSSMRKLQDKLFRKEPNIRIGRRQMKQIIHSLNILINEYDTGRYSIFDAPEEIEAAKTLLTKLTNSKINITINY